MRFLSAGESHGNNLLAILDDFPAGLRFDKVLFESELLRRRSGSGCSPRLNLEKDDVRIVSGVIDDATTGMPIAFLVKNECDSKLFENRVNDRGFPRPGHVDFCAYRKFNYRNVLLGAERSSARETLLRVAAGSFCKMLLREFKIEIDSEVLEIGGVDFSDFNPLEAISDKKNGSYGGVLRLKIVKTPVGLGSNRQWFQRLDASLASALISIPSVKGVYFGDLDLHRLRGKESLDLFCDKFGNRKSNRCGGIEGGISNGSSIVVTLYFKPIPTQPFEVDSISLIDGSAGKCGGGMNDLWCVDRAGVVAESMAAIVTASAFCDKFGSDSLDDMKNCYDAYTARLR